MLDSDGHVAQGLDFFSAGTFANSFNLARGSPESKNSTSAVSRRP